MGTKAVSLDINQIIPLVLARAGYERRRLDMGNEGTQILNYFLLRFNFLTDEDVLPTLISLVEAGIAMARQASKSIDPSLRLEKFLSSIVRFLL